MKRFLLYVILLILTIPFVGTVSAQDLTNAESRKINTMVLDVIDRYEDFAGVYDEDSEYEFIRLFQTSDSPVYAGDLLLGYEMGQTIPASEYAVKLLDFANNVSINISKIRKEQPYFEDGLWYVPVHMQKSIEYTDGSLIISSDFFYEDRFDLRVLMACDLEEDRCKICRIDGSIDSEKVFPMKFMIIRKPEQTNSKLSLDNMLRVNGQKIEYNDLDYAIVPDGDLDPMEYNEIKYEVQISSQVVDSTLRHKEMAFDFKKTRGRFKIRNKYAPMSAYKLTRSPQGITDKSWAYELGFDLGFGVPVGKTGGSRFGLFIGAAASYSNLSLFADKFAYNYVIESNKVNSSGYKDLISQTDYRFSINSITESISFLDLMVPLYMSFDHRFGRKGRVWLNWNIGVKAYMNMNSIIGWSNNSYDVDGTLAVWDKLANNKISDKSFSGTFTEFLSPCEYSKLSVDLADLAGIELPSIELSAAANIALHIKLSRSAFLTLGAGYEMGLTECHLSSRDKFYSQNEVYPFVTDSQNNVIAAYSLYDTVSFQREALWLDLGFMFKF